MTISKILCGLLLVGCCILGYLVFRQKEELSHAKNNAENRVAELERELNASRESLKLLQGQYADNQNSHAATPTKQLQSKTEVRRKAQISDIIKEHPEFASLYRNAIRRNVVSLYGEGLKGLNLSQSQSDKLKALLAEQQMASIDAAQAASAAGIKPLSPEWQEAVKQASSVGDDEIKSILGSDAPNTLNQIKSDVWKAQAQVMLESQVRGLSSDFSDANAPVSTEQSDGLVQALLKGLYWQGKDMTNRPVNYNDIDSSTGLSLHDNVNLNNAAQVLNPEQLKIFQNYSIEMEKIYAIQRQYNLSLSP